MTGLFCFRYPVSFYICHRFGSHRMKQLFYQFMRYYMRVVARFYFGRVEFVGRHSIPVGKPIIYSCNHQNAFMDALLIGAFSPVKITSLTRSDVFGTHAGMWFMTALQMHPIYRMQDGIDKLALNEGTFERVRDRLRAHEGVLIFSEGNHGNDYHLRPLSKGSSRMALESLEKMMEEDVQVVPVGINYFHHQRPSHKLTLAFGKPISVREYWDEYQQHPAKGTNRLKKDITERMREVLMLPDQTEDYERRKALINRKNEGLPFADFKEKLSRHPDQLKQRGKPVSFLRHLGNAVGILNFLPLLIIHGICTKVKDIVFHGSFKWGAAMFLFPIWWIAVFIATGWIWNWELAGIVFGIQFAGLFIRQYLVRWSNPSH
jgi:1-acyl-sn-glycerol-3-phosphate acyltransferase